MARNYEPDMSRNIYSSTEMRIHIKSAEVTINVSLTLLNLRERHFLFRAYPKTSTLAKIN